METSRRTGRIILTASGASVCAPSRRRRSCASRCSSPRSAGSWFWQVHERKWRAVLRAQVDELDALEREFAPDHDRSDEQERAPTRDLLIAAAYERFPDVFAENVDGKAG
jgi:hypothetical protein